jgi:hypothetical protein
MSIRVLVAIWVLSTLVAGVIHAQAQERMRFQGRLSDRTSGTPTNTGVTVTFRMYAAPTGGAALWVEAQSFTPNANGVFNVELGTTSAITGVDFSQPVYIGVEVSTDGEMTPRYLLAAAAFAHHAKNANTLGGLSASAFAQLAAATNTFTGDIVAGSFSGDGSALTNVDAALLGGLSASDFAHLNNGTVTFTSDVIATSFTGDGSGLTNLTAAQLIGTVPAANLSGTYAIDISGNATTATNALALNGQPDTFYRNASNLNAGTLSDTRLSGDVTLQGNTFNGNSQLVQLTGAGVLPALDGSNLTSVDSALLGGNAAAFYLNASNINAGTLNDGRLSANVPLLNAATLSFAGFITAAGLTTTGPANIEGTLTVGDDAATPTAGTLLMHDGAASNTFTGTLAAPASFATANRTWTLPDSSGTIALLSDITGLNLGSMAFEDVGSYFDIAGTNTAIGTAITALNLGTMSQETTADYYTSIGTDTAISTALGAYTPTASLGTMAFATTADYTTTAGLGSMAFANTADYSTTAQINTALGAYTPTASLGTMAFADTADYTTTAGLGTMAFADTADYTASASLGTMAFADTADYTATTGLGSMAFADTSSYYTSTETDTEISTALSAYTSTAGLGTMAFADTADYTTTAGLGSMAFADTSSYYTSTETDTEISTALSAYTSTAGLGTMAFADTADYTTTAGLGSMAFANTADYSTTAQINTALSAYTPTAGLGTMAFEAAADYTLSADLGALALLDSVNTAQIEDGAVNSAKIIDGSIIGTDLAADIDISTTGNLTTTGMGAIESATSIRAVALLGAGSNRYAEKFVSPPGALISFIVPNTLVTIDSIVVVTMQGTGGAVATFIEYVVPAAGSFTVKLWAATAATETVTINYIIVNP